VLLVLSISMVKQLGTEFMPKFDEGNIWLTVVLPTSTSLQESKAVERQVRDVLMGFPEVKLVVSHLGRPEDGTDSKGFNSMEIHVELEPKETWRYSSKVALIEAIKEKVSIFSGLSFNFSQQIQASVEEAISGSQGEVVIKLYGLELAVMQEKANQIVSILNTINGSADVAAEQQMGAGEAQLIINRVKAAMYGLSVADVHKQIEVALGGGVATQILEGERRFDLQVRLQNEGRNSVAAMNDLLIPTANGQLIPLGEVADIVLKTGANRISRESNYRRIAIKSNLVDRDQGSFVKEAMKRVKDEVELPAGYRLVWSGEFENQQRAMQRLYVIVPISLLLIFALLFWAFKSAAQALLVMLTVPFAIAGGILLLWLLGVNLSISAAVGFIVLFGIAVQNGVVMMEYINYLRASGEEALLSIQEGAKARLRPVLMTALMAILGLLPAAVSTGVGAEATRPFALAIIGGLLTATLATLTLLPVLYWLWLRRQAVQKMA
jgi:cobalt-zinc-cadmium resistance protein CzcA